MPHTQMSEFGVILLFITGAMIFVMVALLTAKIIRPHRPNPEKLTTYECGEDPTGTAWGQFNPRFYIIGLIFILFDVELVFLFPWATVFGRKDLIDQTGGLWGWFALVEMGIFVLILALGLAYAWAKGYLDWIRPQAERPVFESAVPAEVYEQVKQEMKRTKTEK